MEGYRSWLLEDKLIETFNIIWTGRLGHISSSSFRELLSLYPQGSREKVGALEHSEHWCMGKKTTWEGPGLNCILDPKNKGLEI